MKLTIKTDLLVAVSRWALQSDDRPHLNVVYVDNKQMVAVDGHHLIRMPITAGPAQLKLGIEPATIRLLAAAQREIRRDHHDGTLELHMHPGESPTSRGFATVLLAPRAPSSLMQHAITVPLRSVGDFPDFEQVFPKGDPKSADPGPYAFDPRFLSDIDEVLKASDQRGVRVTHWRRASQGEPFSLDPMQFESQNGTTFLVMPMRF